MNAPLHRQLLLLAPLDAAAASSLMAVARSLKRDAAEPLRGKNIALMCGLPDADAAGQFAAAAAGLGARVARIEAAPDWVTGRARPGAETARLLEHLYDAVDCEALPHSFALELQEQLAVPVFDGLAREDHPLFSLLAQPDDALDRRALLQAALVSTLL